MVKKVLKKHKAAKLEEVSEQIAEKESQLNNIKKNNLNFVVKLVLIVLVGAGIFLLAQKYRGVFIAGVINNKTVTRWELNTRLNNRYGKTAFDEIITEQLLFQQATKNGIVVSDKEIQDEVAVNEKQFGGKTQLMDMAKQAGINDEKQLNEFFKLKITIKKLQEKLFKAEVKDEEVKKYYDENKQLMGDKKFDEIKKEIADQLMQQKIQTQFTEWFGKIRTESKITSFI